MMTSAWMATWVDTVKQLDSLALCYLYDVTTVRMESVIINTLLSQTETTAFPLHPLKTNTDTLDSFLAKVAVCVCEHCNCEAF